MVWWQYAPVIVNTFFINFNRLAWKGFTEEVATVKNQEAIISSTWSFEPGLDLQSTRDFEFTNELLQAGGASQYGPGEPLSYIQYPVFDQFGPTSSRQTAAL